MRHSRGGRVPATLLCLALLGTAPSAAATLDPDSTPRVSQQGDEKEKPKRKPRKQGKRVTATFVDETEASEPAPAASPFSTSAADSAADASSDDAGEPPAAEPQSERASRPPRDPVFDEEIVVSEVLLDVLVTNRKGEQVTGLGPEDFIVEEDGEKRPVTSVTYYGGPSELVASGPLRTDRYFILLFHDQRQTVPQLTAAQLDAGRWMRRWVEKEMLGNDQVAVLGYDVKLKVYQDFTRDAGAILAAVDKAARGAKAPQHIKRTSGPELTPDSPSLLANLPAGRELSRQSRRLQQALGLVGRAAEGIIGRKNLLLFSIGFGEIHEFGLYTPDRRYYPDMMESLNAGNVAVYGIDLLGALRSSPGNRILNDSLSSIAGDTGGHYYSNFVNVLSPVRQVSEDNLGYYLLAFKTEHQAGDAGYRAVKVRAADGGLQVRARRGYRYGRQPVSSR